MANYCLSKSEESFDWFVSFLGKDTVNWISKELRLRHLDWHIIIRKSFESNGSGDNFTLLITLECKEGEVKDGIQGGVSVSVLSVKSKDRPTVFYVEADVGNLYFDSSKQAKFLQTPAFSYKEWQARGCFRNDAVLLRVKLRIETPRSMECKVRSMRREVQCSFLEDWDGLRAIGPLLYEEGMEPDILLVAGDGVEFKAHKVLLRGYSPVLRVMLSAQSDMTESKRKRIEIKDLGGIELDLLLKFMYDGKAFLELIEKSDEISITNLAYTAEKYQLKALKKLVVLELLRFFRPSSAIRLRKLMKQLDVPTELILEVDFYCKENMEAVVRETSLSPEAASI